MIQIFQSAFLKRQHLVDSKHENAFRLFNGFLEGNAEYVIDIYGKTGLFHSYVKDENIESDELVSVLQALLIEIFPWIEAIVFKKRFSKSVLERNGVYIFGEKKTTWIREHGVRYSVDLRLNRDASFYLDTRTLRKWLLENSQDKTILNTFAYTGSLGVAAVAGGAKRVVQTDLNKSFLNFAKTSHTLNGFTIRKSDFQVGDFWKHMNILKRKGEKFDMVIVDPPFFSSTNGGKVDLSKGTQSMINKVRPLVANGGRIVFINNALFVSGRDLHQEIQSICDDWLSFEKRIDIGEDFVGDVQQGLCDPSPYNHSTKITILGVKHRS